MTITNEEYKKAQETVDRYNYENNIKIIFVSAQYEMILNVDLKLPSSMSTTEILKELKDGYGYHNAYEFNEEINRRSLKLKNLVVNGVEIDVQS